jgi:hypothetical protein
LCVCVCVCVRVCVRERERKKERERENERELPSILSSLPHTIHAAPLSHTNAFPSLRSLTCFVTELLVGVQLAGQAAWAYCWKAARMKKAGKARGWKETWGEKCGEKGSGDTAGRLRK